MRADKKNKIKSIDEEYGKKTRIILRNKKAPRTAFLYIAAYLTLLE
jgi:hypothetical protein